MPLENDADVLIGGVRQAEQFEQRADLSRQERRRQFAQSSDQLEVFGRRLKRVEIRLFGNVAEPPVEGDRDRARCPGRPQNTAPEEVSRSPVSIFAVVLLPDPFGPEVADHFAGPHLEAHVVDGGDAEESLHEVSRFQHG